MFEAYRQKCSAEDLSRLKVALCSCECCLVVQISLDTVPVLKLNYLTIFVGLNSY